MYMLEKIKRERVKMKGNNTTHKELLTFTNLTNLDWHFVDNKTETQDALGKKKIEFKKLKDLLKPELFVRIDEEKNEFGDNVNYVYGERDQNGNYIKETGLIELRQKAGIAMEYLEKWQEYDYTEGKRGTDEGSFLQDWEVRSEEQTRNSSH